MYSRPSATGNGLKEQSALFVSVATKRQSVPRPHLTPYAPSVIFCIEYLVLEDT
jgi:hypothetical protein